MTPQMIEREELRKELDRGGDLKVVMVLSDWAFHRAHIPRTMHFNTLDEALRALGKRDKIVVYCSGFPCVASLWAQRALQTRGFSHVRRHAGGLADWAAVGYPLEGEMIGAATVGPGRVGPLAEAS